MDPRVDLLLSLLALYRNELRTAFEHVPLGLREVRPDIDFCETDTLKTAPLKALIRAGVAQNVAKAKSGGERRPRRR